MSIIRWQKQDASAWPAFGPLFNLRDELDRLFAGPFTDLARSSQFASVWNPAIDLFEDKDNLIVKAELPGLKKEEIEVSLDDGALSISGERKNEPKLEDAETCRAERFTGRFQRTFTLPAEVKTDQVQAQYQDGILTVTLPKTELAKPKQIEIK